MVVEEHDPSEGLANQRECYACARVVANDATRCGLCGAPQLRARGTTGSSPIVVPEQARVVRRRKTTAALLALFLGGIGAHMLYLGDRQAALVRLLLCWTLVPAMIALVELVRLLRMTQAEFERRIA